MLLKIIAALQFLHDIVILKSVFSEILLYNMAYNRGSRVFLSKSYINNYNIF